MDIFRGIYGVQSSIWIWFILFLVLIAVVLWCLYVSYEDTYAFNSHYRESFPFSWMVAKWQPLAFFAYRQTCPVRNGRIMRPFWIN